MSRLVTGWSLAATGALLAIAAVTSVFLLSPPSSARTGMPGGGDGLHAVAASRSATISVRRTQLGRILVGSGGQTLYAFSRDRRNHDACAGISGCLTVWPMVTTHGSPSAGHGVSHSLLSTIRVHGVRQVTYAGHPLYTFAQDDSPGDTGYVNTNESGGRWPAVSPSGHLVR
jgi:predicted lipoprotein with Yx(FWY)xxD motif